MINGLVKGLIVFLGFILIIFRTGSDVLYQNFKKILPSTFISSIEKIANTSNKLINPGLSLGLAGEEVKILQAALSTDKNIYPSGIVSGYFGSLTKQAVFNFQKKYQILESGKIDEITAKKFNEIYGSKNKEYYLSLVPTPVIVQVNIDNNSIIPDLEEWGKAKQVSEHGWTMNVGFDAKMAAPQEILLALNSYRQKHGRNSLSWDDRLANFAKQRAKYFTQISNLDEHAGFSEFVKSEENIRSLGFWWLGENSSYGYRLEGVHLIEWVYAGDQPHNDNQLNPDWTNVGIGIDGYQTDIIFAAHPI